MRLLAHAVFAILVTHAATGTAQPPPTGVEGALRLDVKRSKLHNGLRVVMLADRGSPTVAIEVFYDVGARNEDRGGTGFAHLFEQMMRQGSQNVPRGEHARLVAGRGGELEACAGADHTRFETVLPSTELALGLWLESERMKSLDVSAAAFERQRALVLAARALRADEVAYSGALLRLPELVFQGYWPYEHSVIGAARDLDAAQPDAAKAFYDAYYAPNNAVISIAGGFVESEALALVQRYFGDARAQPAIPRWEPPPLPEQSAPRTSVVEDAHARVPASFSGWMIPPDHHSDHYALDLAAMILGDGESSRLRRLLVHARSVASHVGVATSHHRGPDLFGIDVTLATGARIDQVTKLVDAQLSDLARTGPTDDEMKKLRSRVRARVLFGLESNRARAEALGAMELHRGDASLVNGEIDRYSVVTKEDIKRVVARYLTPARRSMVEVKPREAK